MAHQVLHHCVFGHVLHQVGLLQADGRRYHNRGCSSQSGHGRAAQLGLQPQPWGPVVPMGWVLGVLRLLGVILLFVGVQSYSVLAGGAGQG